MNHLKAISIEIRKKVKRRHRKKRFEAFKFEIDASKKEGIKDELLINEYQLQNVFTIV